MLPVAAPLAVVSPAAHALALWAGLHLLLLLALSMLVVSQRRRLGVPIGDGGEPALVRATRAFGNAVEYAPAALAGLAALVLAGAAAWIVHALGAALFLARIAHAIGLSQTTGVSLARTAGTTLTWLTYLVAGVLLLVYAAP